MCMHPAVSRVAVERNRTP